MRRLSPQVEIALFRVVQEALNNILKHARAFTASINLNFQKESLRVRIEDDGLGFNIQEVNSPGKPARGLGLLGMKERVDLIQGTLDIKSIPGQGTWVTVKVPYGPVSDSESAEST